MAILGISASHDASAAITNSAGEVINAIAEERISRVKNHVGIPVLAIEKLLQNDSDVSRVVFGTQSTLKRNDALNLLALEMGNPSNKRGIFVRPYPGFQEKMFDYNMSPQELIQNFLTSRFPKLKSAEFHWENHHDSHLGCALGMVNSLDTCLLVSLDGDGDGESGAISLLQNSSKIDLTRFSQLDSLGHLYSAVTERYNFKASKHEGKITGLAAYGSHSTAVEILSRYINIENGNIKISSPRNQKIFLKQILSNLGIIKSDILRLHDIVDLAESATTKYEDLAYAIQEVLENSVAEIVEYWLGETGQTNISLAGGVFANVKLNQRIAELHGVNSVRIFPNMGDGGTSLGGIWSYLHKQNKLTSNPLFENMYLAPEASDDSLSIVKLKNSDIYRIEEFDKQEDLAKKIASLIDMNHSVAVHSGAMEFGPRALGNRTLLVNPCYRENIDMVNKRLKRTEFMPFAPIVQMEDFYKYFDIPTNFDLTPFYYMTMTCNVRDEFRRKIPAVVHVDGTARPQLVNDKVNPKMNSILLEFKKLTGISILVNTSLNIHEEPINYSIEDSLKGILNDQYDFLNIGNCIVWKNS